MIPVSNERFRICVVIPAYRVHEKLPKVVAGIPEWVDRIVVVDDACPERSGDSIEGQLGSRVVLIRHKQNQGVGGAMLTGFGYAIDDRCDIIVKMDGDDQMDPGYLANLIHPIMTGMCDFCKGNRFFHLKNLRSMPVLRRVGNIGLTFLTKFASGHWHLSDPTNGYFAIHREAIKLLNFDRISRRYFFETSLLIELNIIRALTLDIPIPARYGDERSSLSIMRCLFGFPPRLLLGLANRVSLRYCFYDVNATTFCIISGLLSLGFGVAFGVAHWLSGAFSGQLQSAGTVALSFLPTITGLLLLLQALVLDVIDRPRFPINRLLGARGGRPLGTTTGELGQSLNTKPEMK